MIHVVTRSRAVKLAAAIAAVGALSACEPLPPIPPPDPPPPAAAQGDPLTVEGSRFTLDPVFRVPVAFTETHRVLYRSEDVNGNAVDVTGTVIVPTTPWLGGGARPVVAYAPGTRGLGDACAPSSTLANGTDYEGIFVKSLLDNGWAVAVTDYEGLGTPGQHTYMVGPSQGKALLNMARAAQRLGAGGLSSTSPVGLMGYSQGGASAGWAAELAPTFAPELDIVGVAMGGVPADLAATGEFLDGTLFSALAFLAAIGADAAFPELDLPSYLNADGMELYNNNQDTCIASFDGITAIFGTAFRTIDDFTTTNPLPTPLWQDRLGRSTLGSTPPQIPVHQYHASFDEMVPLAPAEALRDQYCAAGVQLSWSEYLLAEHALGMVEGFPGAVTFMAARFAGLPATSTCS